jgi:hypothetical protein
MTLMPELHDALARAVAARAPRRHRWRPSRRVGLLAVAGLIASGSALAATGGWHPILGDGKRGHPQEAGVAVPEAQTAAVGVLRRAQTDADRTREVLTALRMLARGEINGVHTDGIRLLRRRPDGVTILVPTARVGRHDKGYPSSIRRQVLCVMTSAWLPARSGGALITGQGCGDLGQVRKTGIGGATRSATGFVLNALVPDGVVQVVIRLRHHRTVTVPVRDNLYEVNTGPELPPGWRARWIDAQGQTIHR